MGTLRKLERQVVRNGLVKEKKSIKRGFESAWNSFRESRYVTKDNEGNVISDNTPKNTMRKKQQHFDNVEQYNRFFAYIDGLKKEKVKEEIV